MAGFVDEVAHLRRAIANEAPLEPRPDPPHPCGSLNSSGHSTGSSAGSWSRRILRPANAPNPPFHPAPLLPPPPAEDPPLVSQLLSFA